MGQIVPDAVEHYLAGLNRAGDSVLDEVAREGATQNLPLVDAEVGALLRVLALSIGARRMLEIGTAIGYSGIWLAGALPPGGMLFIASCSHNVEPPDFAEAVRRGLEDAGRGGRILISAGAAPDHPVHPWLPESAYLKAQTLAID